MASDEYFLSAGLGAVRRADLVAVDSTTRATFETAHGAAFSVSGMSESWTRLRYKAGAAATDTATVRFYWYQIDQAGVESFLGISGVITVNATSLLDAAAQFLSSLAVVGNPGASHARIALVGLALAGGNVDIYAGGRE